MAVNGKSKGNNFERKMANLLSERFAEYLGIEKGFRRNQDSGSYFGGSNSQRTQTHSMDYAVFGDLICPKAFKFSIECKHYKTAPSLQSILDQNVKEWNTWLGQAQQDADNSNKKLALIVKYNKIEELVFLSDTIVNYEQAFKYNSYSIYKLKTFLEQPNEFFFEK